MAGKIQNFIILIGFVAVFNQPLNAITVTLRDGTSVEAGEYTDLDSETVQLRTKYGALNVKKKEILSPDYLKQEIGSQSQAGYKVVTSHGTEGEVFKVYYENGVAIATETITTNGVKLDGKVKDVEYLAYYKHGDRGSIDAVSRWYPWGAIDYFSVAGAYDKFDDLLDDPAMKTERTYHAGLGFRAGLSTHNDANSEIGLSLSYIIGPYERLEQSSNLNTVEVVTRTQYVRALIEYGRSFPVFGHERITLSAAFGIAAAQAKQTWTVNNIGLGSDYTSWVGPSGDISIGIPVSYGPDVMEFDVRKSFFPSQNESPEIKWSPFGGYFKFTF